METRQKVEILENLEETQTYEIQVHTQGHEFQEQFHGNTGSD